MIEFMTKAIKENWNFNSMLISAFGGVTLLFIGLLGWTGNRAINKLDETYATTIRHEDRIARLEKIVPDSLIDSSKLVTVDRFNHAMKALTRKVGPFDGDWDTNSP